MKVDPNWALFVESKSVKWSFGNPDNEFLTFVVNFLTALSQIGEELFGQHGIAQITFDVKKRAGFRSTEIFVVSLENKFFLIMSDPGTTMKLIDSLGGIAKEVEEIMSAVLVGQAAMLYAQCITELPDEETRDYFESIWQNIILDLSDDYSEVDKIVGKSTSNFSILPFKDLLFLHYYIRKQPELTRPLSPKGWGLVSHMSGGEIPLEFNVEKDSVILAGYLAIIISFLTTLFDSKPKNLIFGTSFIQSLSFIHGEDYFLSIDAPFIELISNSEFHEDFSNMNDSVLKDLEESLKKRITEEILTIQTQELEAMDIETLLTKYVLKSKGLRFPKKEIHKRRLLARVLGRL
ncbi:MAG: hypothetical protein ACXADY_20450 [Candidatus Hodarchaeales archaeon]|jgi:hypothetical protein